ncbi:N-acetyltransferase [Proteus mirabilis]|uniref:N-acetyltransferase domain-containing protein n=1 Tax=Proteus mirabilis TaxID=584 RepID=A0AAJ1DGW3_PROMI|nr:GNAT family N-acetyltransferase [Proteus mirabilis]ARX32867.1 hypothetical protein AM402_01485 [Proteus mirabilis]AVA40881.1 N-acetyltransferase [Proteus mirabilis]EJD6318060.1 GNAT family N-acetyltransferase [Proteus mirabilis]EJD6321089.1 GNAT family N-acetyltransferase [Proteus mirabilis]EJD6439363.1 GNAT family N-acetyltransferase [Proteus mirabilis]
MLEIKSIEPNQVRDNCLKERIKEASSCKTTEYIAFMNGVEAGFLSLEYWASTSSACIYEIYVLPEYKEKGIGKELLTFAEKKAIQLECNYIQLIPHPLDSNTKLHKLISWYEKHGYKKDNTSNEYWIKSLF